MSWRHWKASKAVLEGLLSPQSSWTWLYRDVLWLCMGCSLPCSKAVVKNEIKEAPAETSSGLWRGKCAGTSHLVLAELWTELAIVMSWAGLTFPTKPFLCSNTGGRHHNRMRNPRAVLVSLLPLTMFSIFELQ